MCPQGYHHNGFMVTPALGTQDVCLHIVWKDCIVESPECSNCEQWAMHSANSERQGGSPPNPRECSNCLGSGQSIQRITMSPHGCHHNRFVATSALATQDVRFDLCYLMYAIWFMNIIGFTAALTCICILWRNWQLVHFNLLRTHLKYRMQENKFGTFH